MQFPLDLCKKLSSGFVTLTLLLFSYFGAFLQQLPRESEDQRSFVWNDASLWKDCSNAHFKLTKGCLSIDVSSNASLFLLFINPTRANICTYISRNLLYRPLFKCIYEMDFARNNKLPRTYKYEQNKQFWPSFSLIETSWLYTIFVSLLSLWAELILRSHRHM